MTTYNIHPLALSPTHYLLARAGFALPPVRLSAEPVEPTGVIKISGAVVATVSVADLLSAAMRRSLQAAIEAAGSVGPVPLTAELVKILHAAFNLRWDVVPAWRDALFTAHWAALSGLDADADVIWAMPWGEIGFIDVALWGPWSSTQVEDVQNVIPWAQTAFADAESGLPWGRVGFCDPGFMVLWAKVATADADGVLPWGGVAVVDIETMLSWAAQTALDIEAAAAWQEMAANDVETVFPWARTIPLDVWNFSPFEREYIRRSRRRRWSMPWIAAARIIMYKQNIEFKRVSDDHPIRIINGSADIDVDSWCWRLSGTLPSKIDADLVRPDPVTGEPVEVEISINGYVWRFLILSVAENYRWAKGTYQISGYSPTYLLGDPGPRVTQVFSGMSAQQVVASMLTGTAFTYSWDLPEFTWNLPSGALWVQEVTRLRVIQRITEAIGGVIQTDPGGYNLRLQSRYPVSPKFWAGASPDATIMSGLVSLGSRPRPQPRYNSVIVSGRNHGVIAEVRREGTAGDNPAPVISTMALTNQAAVHERGRVELDTFGYHKSDESLLLPLPGMGSNPGLMTPGLHLAVADPADKGQTSWHGGVTGISVGFERAQTRQRVTVERAYM